MTDKLNLKRLKELDLNNHDDCFTSADELPKLVAWATEAVDFLEHLSCRCRDGEDYNTGELVTLVCDRCKLLAEIEE